LPRTIEGNEIRFVQVIGRKFFGFQSYDLFGRKAVLATPAKTLVDCVDRPDLAGGPSEVTRIVFGASRDTDPQETVETALRMQSTALLQRLGFLSDLIGWRLPDAERVRMRSAIAPSRRATFGRAQRREGDIGYVAAWGLLVHAARSDLLTDVPRTKTKKSR